MYKLFPKAGYVVVEPVSPSEFNQSGLADTTAENEKINTGKVLAIGSNAFFENYTKVFDPPCEIGEIIAYNQYSEQKLELNNRELHIVRFDKIIAEIKEN